MSILFTAVLGFCMMATTYVRAVDKTDPVQNAEVLKAQRYMVRLSNAAFRLYWIENRVCEWCVSVCVMVCVLMCRVGRVCIHVCK